MYRIPKPALDGRRSGGSAWRAILLVGAASMLAGCMTRSPTVTAAYPNDYRQRHPIVLKEGERTVEIFVGTNRGGLTPQQRADVLAFAQVWRRESTGGVIIDVPTGAKNAVAADDSMREIRSILIASGIPERGIIVRPERQVDARALAPIRMTYSKIVADVGPCGLWPEDLGPTWDSNHEENRAYWNLGCASQRNLAAMVDNPADLAQPRADAESPTARRTTVLDKYRQGQSTATVYPTTGQGQISGLGR